VPDGLEEQFRCSAVSTFCASGFAIARDIP